MQRTKPTAAALECLFVLLCLAGLHRLLAFRDLAGGVPLLSEVGIRAFVVGLLSDAWTAAACSFVVLIISWSFAVSGWSGAIRYVVATVVILATALTCAHQIYVGFFHFPIIPYHLRYLGDPGFLRGNAAALMDWRSLLLVVAAFVSLGWVRHKQPFTWSKWWERSAYAIALAFCLAGHSRNIVWRNRWFIPDNLQVNPVERLYLRSFIDTVPAPITADQSTWLRQILHAGSARAAPSTPALSSSVLFQTLTKPAVVRDDAVLPVAAAMKAELASAARAGQKPIVMVLLLESLRPSETGYFAPTSGPSLTPHLDELAARGVAFPRAYSTGNVTRGGQEAVLCGYLGSRATSLMRGMAVARVDCLTDLVKTAAPGTLRGETFWYHGGDARFDDQVPYWRRHNIQEFLSRSDFPGDAPHSSWGVGDKVFLARASARLSELRQATTADYLLGLGLSITNHIPWKLPEDAGPEVTTARAQGHPSYATTAYTDAAVGAFVQDLKTRSLWSNMLLVIASDHGTLLPPLVDLYPNLTPEQKATQLESHINLIVTGGLAEAAVARQPKPDRPLSGVVSQADVAAFFAYILDLDRAHVFAETLFVKQRGLPVYSNLDERVAEHVTGRSFTPGDLVNADAARASPSERLALLYYRSFLQFIYAPPTLK